jgi:hypothetical protein
MTTYKLSDERRERMLRVVAGEDVLGKALREHDRLMYVGGFVADDTGYVKQYGLDGAWNDPLMRRAQRGETPSG